MLIMEWKNGTLRSMLKGNKEKVIFLFCSGLLLFVISLPNGKTTDSGLRAGTVEVIADVSGDDESTALEDAGEKAAAKEESGSYEEKLEQRIRELLKSVDGVGEADVMVVLKSSEERIWHVDKSSTSSVTEESGSSSGSSRVIREENQSESTVLDGKSQSPVMEKEVKPEISGVVISADGAEHTYIKNRTFPFMLGRVIDPVIAFDGLPCSKEIKGEIAFQLIDSFLPENSGIYVLRAEDGRIHALKEDVFYDLKCHIEDISGLRLGSVPDPVFSIDAGSLADLFMGAADLSELVEAERATILLSDDEAAEKAVDLAVAMLPRERNWINEWF